MPKRVTDQAVGSFEAAAIMGLHFTQPGRMHKAGKLTAIVFSDGPVNASGREFIVFDGAECEADYAAYKGRVSSGRPRSWLHLRPEVLRRLAAVKTPIAYPDAVGVHDAADLLGVHHTLVPRMARLGQITGRIVWSGRKDSRASRSWIISRKSCLQNVKETRARERAGTKPGPKRNLC
jgi:hypothetical protein